MINTLLCEVRPTVCVTGGWVGEDNAWEQRKLEARKLLENSYSTHPSSARHVGRTAYYRDCVFIIVLKCREAISCFDEVEKNR